MNFNTVGSFVHVEQGDVAFMVVSTVLVFFMMPAGLAFFMRVLVDRTLSLTLMLQIFISIDVVSLM